MIRKIAATATVLLFTSALLASDPPREQKLQQAIDLMESKGDFAHAIPLLEDVARSSDPAVSARGLLYLGQAQERQEVGRARVTYERIVRDFSTQKEAVTEARNRLARLSGASTPAAVTVHQVFTSGGGEWSVTPDGRAIAMQDRSGDIAIRDISTGEIKRLMAKTSAWESAQADALASAWSPVLSPDQRQVAYGFTAGALGYELRLMSNEPNSKSRVLAHNPEFQNVVPSAWSPDGKSILTTFWKWDSSQFIAWVSVADGSVKTLKSLDWRKADDRKSLSPDGRYIAYSALARPDSDDRHVYVLASDGSSETEIIGTPGVNEVPLWTPDGSHVVFSSNRSGSTSLWSIPIKNGKAAGAPSLVKADIGNIFPIGFTRSGSYYYRHEQGGEDVFVADLDSRNEKAHAPVRFSERFVGSNHGPAWSPDGKFVAFKRLTSPTASNAYLSNGYELVVHAMETGEEKSYPNNLTTGALQKPLWFHDGKSILVPFTDRQRRVSYHRLDLKTGQWTEVIPPTQMWQPAAALSPDDRTLYVKADGIQAYDLTTGGHQMLFLVPDIVLNLALSPDGGTLALTTFGISGRKPRLFTIGTAYQKGLTETYLTTPEAKIWLAPPEATAAKNSEPGAGSRPVRDPLPEALAPYPGFRELYVGKQILNPGMLAWTQDGGSILFGLTDQSKLQRTEIMRIPAEGGTAEFTGVVSNGLNHHIDVSPDNSRVAFSSGGVKVSDVWAIDNLLPVLKASK